jgi:hypothetical protein
MPGGGDGSGSADALGTGIDGDTSRANVVFVSQEHDGTFGSIAGADTLCQQEADAASLPGTFVAFLSDSNTRAVDRLRGSRGWTDATGRAAFDTVEDLLAARMFNPIDVMANGTRAPYGASGAAWSGTGADGSMSINTCTDWSGNGSSALSGKFDQPWPTMVLFGTLNCNMLGRLYCFEIGHAVAVAPSQGADRVVFLSQPIAQIGAAGFDMQCATEAAAAGLLGTFVAAIATPTTTIASRFSAGPSWRRIDGTVAITSAQLQASSDPESFVNQLVDGTYVVEDFYMGAMTTTVVATSQNSCGGWTTTGQQYAIGGRAYSAAAQWFWGGGGIACNATTGHVMCMQQ